MTSPSDVRRALAATSDRAVADALAVARTAGTVDAILDTVPEVIDAYRDATSTLAADHYDDLREGAQAAKLYTATPIVDPRTENIRSGLLWAAEPITTTGDLAVVESRLEAVVQLETAQPFRDTILANTNADPSAVGWQRISSGNGCQFCAMLASRGAVYKADTVHFATHPRCHCSASPVFDGQNLGPPANQAQQIASDPNRTAAEQAQLRDAIAKVQPAKPPPVGPAAKPKVGGRAITATDPKVIADARKRGLDPAKLAAEREAKRVARLEANMRARAAAKNLTADHPDVIRAAERFGVHPDQVLAARARVPDLRKAISSEAAETQAEAFDQLYRWNVSKVRNPSTFKDGPPGEYDWLEKLDQGEIERLRRKWYDLDPSSAAPDQLVAEMGAMDARFAGASVDEGIQAWLDVNRRYEAAGAMRRGKIPSQRAYSGQIDANDLAPRLADDGYDIAHILSADDIDAAAHIAQVDAQITAREAYSYLGDATSARYGQRPYEMSFQRWEEEVRELEHDLNLIGTAPTPAQLDRYAELVPRYLDEPGLDYEQLYTRIVSTARQAGEEVPPHAIIPWA